MIAIALQFIGACTVAVFLGVALIGAYALLLRAHRWGIERGWWT